MRQTEKAIIGTYETSSVRKFGYGIYLSMKPIFAKTDGTRIETVKTEKAAVSPQDTYAPTLPNGAYYKPYALRRLSDSCATTMEEW